MIKKYTIFFIYFIPLILFAQENTPPKKQSIDTAISPEKQYSGQLTIGKTYFNKKIEVTGQGEILEAELELVNLTDEQQELYVFVIATFEKRQITKSSFERPIPEQEKLRSFVPFPYDLKNFQYPDTDDKGNVKKNKDGTDKMKFVKFPRDPKAGIDMTTGKPYYLKEKLFIRTTHLSKYRINYFYFNELTVIIFDNNGAPLYRKHYALTGMRH
jgi:hypothetical protein